MTMFFEKVYSHLYFSSNHYFANFGSYFAPRAEELPLLHTWSLAIEMQFYLFYPVLFMCLPCRWRLPVFILLAILLFIWSGYCVFSGSQDAQYFALLARVPEFMSGAVVALLLRDRELPARLAILAGLLGRRCWSAPSLSSTSSTFPDSGRSCHAWEPLCSLLPDVALPACCWPAGPWSG